MIDKPNYARGVAVYSLALCVPPMRQDKILKIDYL